MRDCVFCYMSENHCGYHSMPTLHVYDKMEDDSKDRHLVETHQSTLQAQYQDLSYADMRQVCQYVVNRLDSSEVRYGRFDFLHVAAILDYRGWPVSLHTETFMHLGSLADTGWLGLRIAKEEVTPWDLLYIEVRDRFSKRLEFRVGGSGV